jgi:solute carrier family 25 aspartate/glutamate transporter 12/13
MSDLANGGYAFKRPVVGGHAGRKVKFEQKLLVGAFAGMGGSSIMYPLDIVKTQLQSRATMPHPSIIMSTVHVFRSIVSSSGIAGLYRGFSTCLVGIAPEKAIKLAVNDAVRDYYTSKRPDASIKVQEEIIAGSVAGVLQLSVTVPYEMVKIRLQLQGNVEPALRKTAPQIIRDLGPVGMYRGMTACAYRDIPFCIIFFPLYSSIKSALYNPALSQDKKEPFHVGLVAGTVSGMVSGGVVTPADMLKTRIQQGLAGQKGFFEFGREVIAQDGARALYRGWHTRVAVFGPLYGIVSLAFELQKRWLEGSP